MSTDRERQLEAELHELRARVRDLEREAAAVVTPPTGGGADATRAEREAPARYWAAVVELGTRALTATDLAALMTDVVTIVARTLGVEFCMILEMLPGGDALLLRAGTGWNPESIGRATVAAGRGSQAGFTLLSREPVILGDLRTELRFSPSSLLVDHGVVSGLCVAIPGRGAPFGILGAHTATRRSFTGDDTFFLQSVANVVAAGVERARAAEASRLSDDKVRAILEAAAEGVVIVDAGGRIELVNARTEALFGYDRTELIGRELEVLLPERFRQAHAAHRAGYFAAPRPRSMGLGLELSGRRKDGTEFPVEVSLSFVQTETGLVALGFIIDITARRALERTARQADKLASLGTLAAGLAHELNNPIGIIFSRAELMLLEADSRSLPDDLREDLGVLQRHAQRVSRITHGLLSFARQSTGAQGSVDLNRLVEDTMVLIEPQLVKAGIVVRRRLTSGLPAVSGDVNALQQVLMNLLTNARDALPGGGEIAVETSLAPEPSTGVRLTVRDTGSGIPPDILPRIFDPFYTTKPEGTGLGLSIAYGIVRDHQATIDVQSSPGRGTTFVLTFPSGPPASRA
jgi:PAS domain S-box-containing protein